METTEKIVEAYVRYVKRWATIPNIRCGGQFEIDLLAIDPKTCERYHIETSISVAAGFAKLTGTEFDSALHKPTMRRTIGYFINRKFETPSVTQKLAEYGFEGQNYTRVIATWDVTEEAEVAARAVHIELWRFPKMMRKIARWIERESSYFTDDTLRTIGLYVRALEDAKNEPEFGG